MQRRHLLQAFTSLGAASLAGCSRDPGPAPPSPPVTLTKAPWVQLVGPRAVRLRFETRVATAVPVVLSTADGDLSLTPELFTREISYERTAFEGSDDYYPDEAGSHTVQEVVVDDLEPGTLYNYRVAADEAVEGSFKAPPRPGESVRVGWLADTSWPFSKEAVSLLTTEPPDLFVHGGDLQYQTSPFDTWNGMSRSLAGVTSRALAHMIVGNHENEDNDELEQMYDRLFGGQGDPHGAGASGGLRYFAFTYGAMRWLCLDSETLGLGDDPAQLAWFEEALGAAASESDIQQIVVAFHRPVYSLSKHFSASTSARDAVHPLLLEHGVKLVLCGHAHCYERFLVDGVSYVVDGGGGALLYDPNEGLSEAERVRPGDVPLRVAVSETHGATRLTLAADGTLGLERRDTSGAVTDAFELAPKG